MSRNSSQTQQKIQASGPGKQLEQSEHSQAPDQQTSINQCFKDLREQVRVPPESPIKPMKVEASMVLSSPCKSETHEKVSQASDKKPSQQIQSQQGCGCSKSGCLKLYCACFSKGVLCGGLCNCCSCKNSTDNPERSKIIHDIIMTDPTAFYRRNQQFGVSEGCNCRKSGCNKKYCECFRRGRRCVERCTCFSCKNMKEGHVKTQNRTLPEEDTFRLTYDLLKKKIKLT